MYECLIGLPPFHAGNLQALLSQIQVSAPDPLKALRPELDDSFVDVIEKALRKDPAQRWQTAQEMIDALEPWARARRGRTFVPPSDEQESDPDASSGYFRTTVKQPKW
jgi:serine/threonine protein kinase